MTYKHAHENAEVKAYCDRVRADHAQDLLDGLIVQPIWDESLLKKEVKRFNLKPRTGKALKRRRHQIEAEKRERQQRQTEKQTKKRKGADSATNGDNRRTHKIGQRVKCANPQCPEYFRANSENHRYHSYSCRTKHQRHLRKEQSE